MSFGVKNAIFGVSSGHLRGEVVPKNYATKVQKKSDIRKIIEKILSSKFTNSCKCAFFFVLLHDFCVNMRRYAILAGEN